MQLKRNKNLLSTKYSWQAGKGFTLVETLLYVSIVSVMLLVMSAFLFLILQSRTKFQTISEVDQQGIQVVQILTQVIRNSKKINVPSVGSSGAMLSLDTADVGKTPTVFSSAVANMQIKEGTGAAIPLTSAKVLVSGLNFSNVSGANTPGSVKFQFTLTYVNPSGRNEYVYSKTFYGSASLRFN